MKITLTFAVKEFMGLEIRFKELPPHFNFNRFFSFCFICTFLLTLGLWRLNKMYFLKS